MSLSSLSLEGLGLTWRWWPTPLLLSWCGRPRPEKCSRGIRSHRSLGLNMGPRTSTSAVSCSKHSLRSSAVFLMPSLYHLIGLQCTKQLKRIQRKLPGSLLMNILGVIVCQESHSLDGNQEIEWRNNFSLFLQCKCRLLCVMALSRPNHV